MKSINVHEAKTRLSELVARASKGEAFIIAKSRKTRCADNGIRQPGQKPTKAHRLHGWSALRAGGFLSDWMTKPTCWIIAGPNGSGKTRIIHNQELYEQLQKESQK